MKFIETSIPGAFVIDPERLEDERGFFARSWCREEFEAHGCNADLAQCNISFNRRKGTLRGMHYQAAPHEEAKLVRCTLGAIYDVVLDLRPSSSAYLKHFGVVLSAQNRSMLYLPEGTAHGFLSLEDNTEIFYQMSSLYAPGAARGYRHNDPAFAIKWPDEVVVISERDRTYPDFAGVQSKRQTI